MSEGKFKCNVTLGNDAMQTPQELAELLRELANQLDGLDGEERLTEDHKLLDDNGNEVGKWELELEPSDDEDDSVD